jgi:predicted nucleic acid-binding Zn ribbon protein
MYSKKSDDDSKMDSVHSWIARIIENGPLLFSAAEAALNSKGWEDVHARNTPYCSLLHFRACLLASVQGNSRGEHSLAACLLRQCVESLTLIEVGLLEESIGEPLARDWHDGKRSHGELRRELESKVWIRYGTGLWKESWCEFFANLAKAVQPYAHYSQSLMMWQLHAVTKLELAEDPDLSFTFLARVGPMFEDTEKTTQISVLQALVLWALGSLIISNCPDIGDDIRALVDELGVSIKGSGFVVENVSWCELLIPVLASG